MAEFREEAHLFDPDIITSIEILNADGSVMNFETGWEKYQPIYRLAYNPPEGELYIWHAWNIVTAIRTNERIESILRNRRYNQWQQQ